MSGKDNGGWKPYIGGTGGSDSKPSAFGIGIKYSF